MQDPIQTMMDRRSAEWSRVNALLPWDQAPEWARFAFFYMGHWSWLEKPPETPIRGGARIRGNAAPIEPIPRILTDEHLFRHPCPATAPSGITRLLQANVPVKLAGKVGFRADPEREALLAYAKIMDAARARFGSEFDKVVRDAVN